MMMDRLLLRQTALIALTPVGTGPTAVILILRMILNTSSVKCSLHPLGEI
jgi:hypothetical protein